MSGYVMYGSGLMYWYDVCSDWYGDVGGVCSAEEVAEASTAAEESGN